MRDSPWSRYARGCNVRPPVRGGGASSDPAKHAWRLGTGSNIERQRSKKCGTRRLDWTYRVAWCDKTTLIGREDGACRARCAVTCRRNAAAGIKRAALQLLASGFIEFIGESTPSDGRTAHCSFSNRWTRAGAWSTARALSQGRPGIEPTTAGWLRRGKRAMSHGPQASMTRMALRTPCADGIASHHVDSAMCGRCKDCASWLP